MSSKIKNAPVANGHAKGKSSPSPTNGTTTPLPSVDKKDSSAATSAPSGGRPDKKLYEAEQDTVKKEIDALQAKLSVLKEKISSASKGNSGGDKRAALRAELDELRERQSGNKTSRGKVLEQVKALEENIRKKTKDINAAKAKMPFKTVAEVDAHIRQLEKQVESGNMKLADEKRALQEISTSRRNRRLVEGFQTEEEAIKTEQGALAKLREQLNDPESKALSERYEAVKAQLDELKKESDVAHAGRSKLIEERDALQSQINALWNSKREAQQRYKEANDRYWAKVNEDKARRAERFRAQREAEEAEKKKEIAERLLEEAQIPAFQAQVEDCQTLIDYFEGKTTGTVTFKSNPAPPKSDLAGVPKLELRQVEASTDGLVVRKKKGEEEESYFVGTKGKGKGRKAPPKANESIDPPGNQLNVPLATLSALMTLSIPPPVSTADVPRLIEDLKTKKAWYEANQTRVTEENVTKARADIERLAAASAVPSSEDPVAEKS